MLLELSLWYSVGEGCVLHCMGVEVLLLPSNLCLYCVCGYWRETLPVCVGKATPNLNVGERLPFAVFD